MEILSIALQLLLSLSILVTLHEFGHFAAARIFKTRVEKFYLFFDFLFPFSNIGNFAIFKIKRGETEYGLGWFPLGGYVKISGMADETTDKSELEKPAQPWEFRSKPAWQRLIIILGGIIVNLILGVLILWMVKFTWGDKYVPIDKVQVDFSDSTMTKYGFQNGDMVLGYKSSSDIVMDITLNDQRTIRIDRNGEKKDIKLDEEIVKQIVSQKGGYFQPRVPMVIKNVPKSSPNISSGLQKGDIIAKIDTVPITYLDEYRSTAKLYKGKTVDAQVLRNGNLENIKLAIDTNAMIGVELVVRYDKLHAMNLIPLEVKRYTFFSALPAGFNAAVETIVSYVKQFKLIFKPSTGAYKQVGGFGGMAKMFDPEWDWEIFWRMTGIISLILAFMNFLPIPMLDGGYMVFILYEMITRRKPSEKFMEVANTMGFLIVIALIVFANGNDIYKAIFGK